MIDKKIMKAYLDMPEQFRKIVISDSQISIVRAVQRCGYPTMTSRELSNYKGISVQSATQRLKRLWELGYLSREERIDDTGGIIYRYSSAL